MSEVVIRWAASEDAAEVVRVLTEAFEPYRRHYTPEALAATVLTPEAARARMAEGPVWVAVRDGVCVATASAVIRARGCYVRGMAVVPSAQGGGLGRALLDEVEAFALEERQPCLYLSTTPYLHRAIALYERFGFHRTEDGPHHLFGTPLFTMAKPLG